MNFTIKDKSSESIAIDTIRSIITRRSPSDASKIFINSIDYEISNELRSLINTYSFIKLNEKWNKPRTRTEHKKISVNIDTSIDYNESVEVNPNPDCDVIISMTSWKGRLWLSAYRTLVSLLNQKMNVKYKVVLVLSSDEINPDSVPDEIKNLSSTHDNFELLWVKRNIRSHKKLMPVIKRYPNLPIIISDDDCVRNADWAQGLWNAYKKEPKYIHTWACGKLISVGMTMEFDFNSPIKSPSILNRAANGNVGTIYPPHIFDKNKDFFNANLYMRLSPTSDETWQWCFQALLGIKTKPISYDSRALRGKGRIQSAQETALFNINSSEYPKIYTRMLNKYPKLRSILRNELNKSKSTPREVVVIK